MSAQPNDNQKLAEHVLSKVKSEGATGDLIVANRQIFWGNAGHRSIPIIAPCNHLTVGTDFCRDPPQ